MATWLAGGGVATAQQVPPYRLPSDDELDPQGRTSTVLGSGARALGMGGAFLARADDATAASWNPAGLSYLRRPEISVVGAQSRFSKLDFFRQQDDDSRGTGPDFAAIAYPFSWGSTSGAIQASFQRVVSLDYTRMQSRPGVTSPGVEVRLDSEGGFDVIALGSGIRLSKQLRVGFTYNHWFNRFSLDSSRRRIVGVPESADEETSDQFTKMSLRGWNFNLGIIYSPIETVSVGAVLKTPFTSSGSLFRTRVDTSLDRRTTIRQTKVRPDPTSPNPGLRDAVELKWPRSVGFGVSWRPFSTLTLAADVTTTYWSKARLRNYFYLRSPDQGSPDLFDYGIVKYPRTDRPGLPLPYPNVDLVASGLQEDAHQFRFGAEYILFTGALRFPLRLGYFRDEQNFPGRHVRDAFNNTVSHTSHPIFHGVTLGAGVAAGDVVVDAAYIYESGQYLGDEGIVRTRSHRTLVSLIYRFGQPR